MNKLSRKHKLFYLLFISAHIVLVWMLPYFPTQDGPSHIYNLVILRDLLNGGKEWGNYFTCQLHAVPNLGFNLLSYPLLHFFPPQIVEKIFISIYIVLMGTSVPFFLKTFNNKSTPFVYFIFPVIFNFTLMMGFYSYVITVPLFLIAFSLFWRIHNHITAHRFVIFNLAGLIIFYFHLIPFVFLLLSLICITIVQSKGFKRIIFDQIKLMTIISPSLFILLFYLVKGSKSLLPDFSYLFYVPRYIYLRNDLFFFSTVTFSPWQMLPGFTLTFLFLSFFIVSVYLIIKTHCKKGKGIKDIPPSKKVLICLSLLLILIYLVAPFRLGEGDFFNQRFPWVIFLILLPLLQFSEKLISKPFVLISTVSVVIVFFVFNSVILWQQSDKIEKFLSALNVGLPKGAYIMTYKRRNPEAGWPRIDVLMHAASYYGIFNGCVDIGNYETGLDYFPIHLKEPSLPIPPLDQIGYKAETINWPDYPSIQYLLGWEVDKNDTKKLSNFFHIIYRNDPFSLWERKPT